MSQVFAACYCIWLSRKYLQRVSVFGCVASICSVFLYLVESQVFAVCFCIWLSRKYLQRVSVFGCVASICSMLLYAVVS